MVVPFPIGSMYGIFTLVDLYGTCTHRRVRLPQRHNAPPATQPQTTVLTCTHSSFRVLNFRDWFGVQIMECTLRILQSTFRALKILGIGLGFHASSAPFFSNSDRSGFRRLRSLFGTVRPLGGNSFRVSKALRFVGV